MLSLNLHPDHRAGWVEDTFLDKEAAENALNGQYADFTSRDDIMEFVPTYIRPRIGFHEADARISGFSHLFTHLNKKVGTASLRPLVKEFFYSHPVLREHLS